MTHREAAAWLKQVDGTVFRNGYDDADDSNRYVALVRTPAPPGRGGKVILAFGESFAEATRAAEAEWHSVWRLLSEVH